MKNKIGVLAYLFVALFLSSCSSSGVDSLMAASAGNKYPQYTYGSAGVIKGKHLIYIIPVPPNGGKYKKLGGWITTVGESGDLVTFSTRNDCYHILIKYKRDAKFTKQDLHTINDDLVAYKNSVRNKRLSNIYFTRAGHDKYRTVVWSEIEKKWNRTKKTYLIKKYNLKKTSAEKVMITLSHTKKKGFSFRELEKIAKVIVDTMYIK